MITATVKADLFHAKFGEWVEVVNRSLDDYVKESNMPEKTVYEAMRYSLMAGGKRLRPVLSLAVCEMLDGTMNDVLPFACAIEMIHTYSLIHDDLPAMDNDDYRRGRLTNHKVYGEAMAVLAGDALLNKAFEIILNYSSLNDKNMLNKVKAAAVIAKAAGTSGMIGGQVVDLESEGKEIALETLEYMHKCKTGALIKAPVVSAAILCNAGGNELSMLEGYAGKIGLAFQIKDDILDVEGSLKVMGKKSGSDAAKKKSTYVTLYGLEDAKNLLRQVTEEALGFLEVFGERAYFLKFLANYLVTRET